MADNIIRVTYKVNEDGSLEKISQKAKKAAASTNEATGAAENYNKAQKGVAGSTSNSTKAFSKMTGAIGSGGLVGAYAGLAANVFALTAAFGILSRASALEQLEKGLIAVGNAGGQNLPYLSKQVKELTGNAVALEQAMRATAVATSAGFSSVQLLELTKVAKGASIALGRDMGDALDRLVRGTAKLEPEILDELGIMVRLDEASQNYAKTLGKQANELSRWEKQQAFLNATIEQGQKKFEVILKYVDPDPYQQLAAAFQDLTKQATNLVNFGLKPIVQFLSDFPSALFGGLLLFASSIKNAILPTLNMWASRQRDVAAEAAAAAKASSKIISKEYTSAAQTVSKAWVIVPKSLQSLGPAAAAGTLTLKEQEFAIKQLTASEKLRAVALTRYVGTQLADKQAEYNATVKLREEIIKLSAAEKTRSVAGPQEKMLNVKSASASIQSDIYDKIDQSGVFKGFKAAAEGTSAQFALIEKGTPTLDKAKQGFNAVTKSVGLFGRALLNAIPVIGQVLFFGSLLLPLFGDLFKKSKVIETANEVTESFSSFGLATQQLSDYLSEARTEEEAFQATLKVRVGIIDQIVSGIKRIADAQNEAKQLEIQEKFNEAVKAENRLRKAGGAPRATPGLIKQAADAQEEYQQALRDSTILESAGISVTIKAAIEQLKLNKNTTAYTYELEKLKELEQELINSKMTKLELDKRLASITDPSQSLQASINATAELSQKYDELAIKSKALQSGESGELYDTIKGIPLELETAATAMDTMGETTERNVALTKKLTDQAAYLNIFLGKGLITVTDYVQTWKDIVAQVAKNNVIIAEGAKNTKNLNDEAKSYGEISSANAAMKEMELDTLKSALEEEKKVLNARIQNAGIALQGDATAIENSNEIKELRAELLGIDNKILGTSENYLKVQQESIKHAQRMIGYEAKSIEAAGKILELSNAKLLNDGKMAALRANASFEADAELKILKEQKESTIAQIEKKGKAEAARVALEFDLLDLQFKLEESKIRRLFKEGKLTKDEETAALAPIAEVRTKIGVAATGATAATGLRGDQEAAVAAETAAQVAAVSNKITELEIQNDLDVRTAKVTTIKAIAKAQEEAGLRSAARASTLRASLLEEANLRADIDKLSDGTAKTKKQTELQALLNTRIQEERAYRSEIFSKVDAASGGYAGAISQAITQIQVAKAALIAAQAAAGQPNAPETAQADVNAAKKDEMLATFAAVDLAAMKTAEAFRAFGPEGELMATVLEGASSIGNTLVASFEIAANASNSTADRISAGLAIAQAGVSALSSIMAANSKAKIAGVDAEIAAEQKRDGKSAESIARIQGLEKKKEALKRKAFESNKKMQMAQVVISTASAVASATAAAAGAAAAAGPLAPAVFAGTLGMMNGIIIGLGAAQLAMIAGTSYQGGGSIGGAGAGAPSSAAVGNRQNTVDLAKARSPSGELAYARGAQGVGTGMTNYTPSAFTGMKYRATGGNTSFMVGEQGPEIFTPERPGRITPADETGNMGGTTNVTFTINAIDSQGIEDVLNSQRGNLVGIIREAANAHGESFLENVNVESYQGAAMGGGGSFSRQRTGTTVRNQ